MSETIETTREQELEERIAVARKRVDALVREAMDLGGVEHDAQRAGDVGGVLAVRRRGAELDKVIRRAKANLEDALADLEAYRAARCADDPEQLARVDFRKAELAKLQSELDREQAEIDSRRKRRDHHLAQETEHRYEARRLSLCFNCAGS